MPSPVPGLNVTLYANSVGPLSPKENWIGEIIRPPATGRLHSVLLCTALAPCIMPNSRNFKSMSSLPTYPPSKTMRTVRTDLVDEMKPSESFWSSHNNHRRTSPVSHDACFVSTVVGLFCSRRLSRPSSGENDGGFSTIFYPRHGRPFNRCLWSTGLEKSPGKLQHSPPFIIPSPGSVHALSSKCLVPIQTGSLGEMLTRADIEVEALLPAPKLLDRPTVVLSSHSAPQCFLAFSQHATKHLPVEFAKTIDALLTENPKIYSPQSNTPDESLHW